VQAPLVKEIPTARVRVEDRRDCGQPDPAILFLDHCLKKRQFPLISERVRSLIEKSAPKQPLAVDRYFVYIKRA